MLFEELEKKTLDWNTIESIWDDIAIVICNPQMPDCPIIFVNDRFLEHSGYERAEIIGRNCRFMQGPDTEPDSVKQFRTMISNRKTGVIAITNYTKNGEKFKNKILLTTVKDRTGSHHLIVAVQKIF